MKRLNKKGFAVYELLVGVVILFILGIVALIGFNTFTELNDDFQASPDVANGSKLSAQNSFDAYAPTLDALFLTVVGLLWVVFLVASWFADSHPAYMIVLFVVLIAIFVVAGFLSNGWEEISDDSEFSAGISNLPMTNFLLDNFMLFFIAAGFSSMIAMFMKNRSGAY